MQQLNLLVTEQQLYLNNQFSVSDLAHASGFSLHPVSAALNVAKDSCFYGFINALRVKGPLNCCWLTLPDRF
ncbi:MAG: hypothetical protein MJK10_01805 [Pseudomonadales bacterium]|nr:hypothetical protein [Pseudomonadales bacterium]NRA14602.1 hypothetical protein [Oceanospirillaceae bacterium]